MEAYEPEYQVIDGAKIHFRRQGSGPAALLLIHGAVGSHNDFRLQLEEQYGLSWEQFTLVALDLPGYGRSQLRLPAEPEATRRQAEWRSPKRHQPLDGAEPTLEYFEHCASVAGKLMETLGYKTYSLLGWSDGARVASLLASSRRSRINSLILWGFLPSIDERSSYAIARTRDTGTWQPEALEFYSKIYGSERFSELWRNYVDYLVSSLEFPNRLDVCKQLTQIKCPTLVLHGKEDPIVSFEHHVRPLDAKIYDLDIKQMDGLAHNLHQANPGQFNRIVSNFVVSSRA